MQNLTQPTLLLKPFAQSGDKNTLLDVNTDLTNPQKADLTNGFPQITSKTPDDGGLPPERADFNGLGYLTTLYDYFYQCGGTFTFNSTICTAIGGYPAGARLWYTDSDGVTVILRSTKDDNTSDFTQDQSVIGTDWVIDTPTADISSFVGDIKASLQTANHGRWLLCDGQAVSRTTYANLFALIGDNFGEGDGSTTFNLPDYRGKFLRGLGGDSAADVYTTQAEGLPEINIGYTGTQGNGNPDGGQDSGGRYYPRFSENIYRKASQSSAIYGASTHVTPINQAVNYFIRA